MILTTLPNDITICFIKAEFRIINDLIFKYYIRYWMNSDELFQVPN